MKRILLFSILSILCLTLSAQTKTWIGSSGGFYSDGSNWSPAGVPGQSNDVIFPNGSNVNINIPPDIRSFELQGDATVSLPNNITFSQASTIGPNATFIWSTGIMFGSGTLTNNGTLNITGNIGKSLGNTHTLINNGIINNDDTGSLSLGFGSPILNNTASGIINLNSNSSITFQQGIGTLINSGLIRRQQSTGIFRINANFQNNNGTISVESGTLKLDNDNSLLTDGIYNVSSGSTLEWAFGFTLLGTLTGQLDGQINWTGALNVSTGTEAILDFNGPVGINWTSGFFAGNGTLTNRGDLNFVSANPKSVRGQSDLNNEGIINYNGMGSISLGFGSPTLTNASSGVINLNSDASFAVEQGIGTVVNSGLIIKQQGTGTFGMNTNNNNISPGKIMSESGVVSFAFNGYVGDGILGGNATVDFQGGTLFEGTIAPGSSPGTLTHTGNYNSSAAAILDIEINGPNAGTEYDVFAIQGNAVLDGTIAITMGFAANVNDEFVILTSPNITSCNLPATVSGFYQGLEYIFDVICNPTNVTLRINDIVLGIEENKVSNFSVYPNPSYGNFTIDFGKEYTDVTIQISNMLGQVISSESYASGKTIEQEITASAGMYFVNISTSEGVIKTLKIIKK